MSINMNHKILEMAQKSGIAEIVDVNNIQLAKFADMIIKECARIAKYECGDDDERHCCTDVRHTVAKTIRREFGIK